MPGGVELQKLAQGRKSAVLLRGEEEQRVERKKERKFVLWDDLTHVVEK